MSSQLKGRRVMALLPVAIALLCIIATVLPATAQDEDNDHPAPKWELYGGYSFFHAGADIHGQLPGALFPLSSRLEVNPRGVGLAATYNFNRWFGLTLDGSTHWGSGERTTFSRIDDTGFSNLSIGPKFTFRSRHFAPFLEALVGDHRLMPDAFHDVDKLGVMAGGGLDWNLSRHFALRLIRADYVYSNYRYGVSKRGLLGATGRSIRRRTGHCDRERIKFQRQPYADISVERRGPETDGIGSLNPN
jgi:opacity protein-like surface antigen